MSDLMSIIDFELSRAAIWPQCRHMEGGAVMTGRAPPSSSVPRVSTFYKSAKHPLPLSLSLAKHKVSRSASRELNALHADTTQHSRLSVLCSIYQQMYSFAIDGTLDKASGAPLKVDSCSPLNSPPPTNPPLYAMMGHKTTHVVFVCST